jgi:hypothetical protein
MHPLSSNKASIGNLIARVKEIRPMTSMGAREGTLLTTQRVLFFLLIINTPHSR